MVIVKLETDNETIKKDPCCCVTEVTVWNSTQLKAAGHILRKISSHAYLFLKEKKGRTFDFVYSMECLPSPSPGGGWKYHCF